MAEETVSVQKIKYALHLVGWSYEEGNAATLLANGKKVPPAEYEKVMQGHLFCPTCKTNVSRVPHDKEYFSNSRDAHYRHLPKYDYVPCVHRTKKPEGKRYDSYEEARKAVEAEDLVVVEDFLQEKPELPPGKAGEYDETAVENPDGQLSQVPISRHDGETFALPSKVKTVRGICRKFDENLKKYFVFPGMTYSVRLDGLLHNIEDVTEIDESPKLYFGVILRSFTLGQRRDSSIRMTRIRCNEAVVDFTLKTKEGISAEHGLRDDSEGRIVLAYGCVEENGVGLCIKNVGWGGFDLLPRKYEHHLILS